MVAIGELAFKATFNATQLTKGLMSTRQQMSAAKKLAEDTRTPLDRYKTGLDNLAAMSARYSHVAAKQVELSKQLERSYLQEESAVRRLTKAEKSRLELLQLPDQIKARAAANSPAMQRAARDEANKKAGLARRSFFVGIDQQQDAGRSALADRLAVFKKERAAATKAEEIAQAKAAKEAQAQSKGNAAPGGSGMFSMAMLPKYIGAAAVASYAKSSVLKFAEVEKSAAAFEVLSGSMQKSKQLMTELRDLAKTGLSFGALSSSAQTMMSFGVATEKIVPTLKALGDISRGDGERLKSLALAFGQTTAAGRLMGQEVLQMINAGFNPLQEISRKTGRSMVQLKKDMEDGSISASMVADSLISATTAGGRFSGMLAKISETGAGSLTTIQNKFEAISLAVGESLIPLVKQLSGAMEDLGKVSAAGRTDSMLDLLSNSLAGSAALIRSFLRNDWKPMSEVLDSMDAKKRDAEAAAAPVGSALEQRRGREQNRLMNIYANKNNRSVFKTEDDYKAALARQHHINKLVDAEIAKEKALNKEKERRAEFAKKEKERIGQIASLLKPMQDQQKLEQFNAKSKIKASSLDEMSTIQKMNAQERGRYLALQNSLQDKDKSTTKSDSSGVAKKGTNRETLAAAASDLTSRMATPLDQFRSQLKDIMVMSGAGMISRDVRDRAMSSAYDSTIGSKRPEMQLAPDLRMGTQGAYQALTGIQNSAQDRAMKLQEKQTEILREGNRLLGEVKTAIKEMKDELKEVLPGDGG